MRSFTGWPAFHLALSANVVRPDIVCRMREVLILRWSQFQRFLLPNKAQAARSKAHCGSTMPDAALPMDCPDAPRNTISFLPTRFALDRLDRPHRRDLCRHQFLFSLWGSGDRRCVNESFAHDLPCGKKVRWSSWGRRLTDLAQVSFC